MTTKREAGAPGVVERVTTGVLYVLFGALLATIGTFAHRARFDVAGHAVWFGVVLALLCTVMLTVGVRMYLAERWSSYGFAIGLVLGVAWYSFLGAGHSVLVVADAVGYAWLIGSILIAVVVTFWPRLPARGASDGPSVADASAVHGAAGQGGHPASAGGAAGYPGIVPESPNGAPKESAS
ncbi:hypothetical protein F8O01_16650 [Pseudoclavibacter chungangensis]|uniref:Uncharacterized protein n=1 Tax=Pseudoclavibacter chungangensis TaxID=587635 RepID=A0A7J5BMI7_9MICO|nr:hypothetical protein [Pseudoclavibacter chungangensis]KAB1652502.1 hypothetical protein F8O01_16650 [Pseudoclavibacter chungangensis]NYJ66092.1 hypothetical protein [Pseudoclavibacter chungangensis]